MVVIVPLDLQDRLEVDPPCALIGPFATDGEAEDWLRTKGYVASLVAAEPVYSPVDRATATQQRTAFRYVIRSLQPAMQLTPA